MQTCDVDYRTAYQIVGIAVREANAAGLRGIDLDGARLDAAAQSYAGRPLGLTGRDLTEVLDPRTIVETRTAAGGAAPPIVEGMASACVREARQLEESALTRLADFDEVDRRLIERATALVSSEQEGSA
jgi:argininosuccinate lyase